MNVCGLSDKVVQRIGLGATSLGLVLYQLDGLKAVSALHIALPLHFVQGLFLGVGLTMMVGAQVAKRRRG